jgi:predicted NAD/FAD-binding protein
MHMTSVAVIGGGAAGIGAARALLAAGCDVALFEAGRQLGGNCFPVAVPLADGGLRTIDAGVSDFNRTTFPACTTLFAELGLPTRPIGTDASFATVRGRPIASCQRGAWWLAAGHGDPQEVAAAIDAFRLRVVEVLATEGFAGKTLGEYLDRIGASRVLRDVYVYPRAMGCFPSPDREPSTFDVRRLVEFWRMHGVVGEVPADRHTIEGGMHRYPLAFAAWFAARGGELQCGARVLGINRREAQVEIRYVDRDDRHRRRVTEHVVFANHARDVLPLLDLPSVAEQRALRSFPCQRARVVVHRDARLVSDDRARWGAFHYVVSSDGSVRCKPTITFFPKRLAGLPESDPDVFVTMNPHCEPDPDEVLAERFFVHPVASSGHDRAVAAVAALQGQRRTWFAGSYLRSPFVHENALQSGMHAAARLLRSERQARRRCQVA